MADVNSIPKSSIGLDTLGLRNLKSEYWNLSTPALYEEALKRNEGIVSHLGPLVVRTDLVGQS
jgi:phosphoenolpyruvate carboxykinase (ATP)